MVGVVDEGALTALAAAIGGLGFAFTGALGAALALGAKRGGLLIAVVVLPLFIPPVVFGAGALTRAADGGDPLSALALLSAYVLFAVVIAPVAGAVPVSYANTAAGGSSTITLDGTDVDLASSGGIGLNTMQVTQDGGIASPHDQDP